MAIRTFLLVALAFVVLPGFTLASDLIADEARLLAEVRQSAGHQQAEALWELARLRERIGKFQAAIDTWGYLKKTYGKERAPNESSAPSNTYHRLAEFRIARIKRIQNLLAHSPSPPSQHLRRRLSEEQEATRHKLPYKRAGYLHFYAPVDMDGDLVPELFAVIGQRQKLGEVAKGVLLVFKWTGEEYEEVLRSSDFRLGDVEEPDFRILDRQGYGMYSIVVGFERETDNVASIESNGREITWVY